MDSIELRKAIRSKYAWPGGYPMVLMMMDGEPLCMDCARKEYKQIARSNRDAAYGKDWAPVAVFINWEDTQCYCTHCNSTIKSTYGDRL